VRLHASSGTTGKPIVVAYTREDLDVWAEVMVRSFASCGLHAGCDQNAYGYGCSPEVWARITEPSGSRDGNPGFGGNTERQIMVLKDFGVTAICCTPSYFLHLLERRGVGNRFAHAAIASWSLAPNVDRRDAAAHAAGCGDQGLRHLWLERDYRARRRCGMRVQDGLHIFEDHFYPEIVDPANGERYQRARKANLC